MNRVRASLAVASIGMLLALGACGLESAGTAATAGAAKQIEVEQAHQKQQAIREQLQRSMDEMNKRNEQLGD